MKVTIKKEDIIEDIYFITAITQKQGSSSMPGALSSRGDLMGGIFDRWINTVPERIVFNKIILPKIENSNTIEVIPDYYLYDPKKTGIAPDVIGIKVKEKIIPFSIFEEKWMPVENMPQIEVKSFKEKQYMVTLRDQDYSDKYLVMCETDLRVDYLLPFFDKSIFDDIRSKKLAMDDSIFIKSNALGELHRLDNVNNTSDDIGTIDLMKITRADSFMRFSTLCEEHVSAQYLKNIEKIKIVKGASLSRPLKEFFDNHNSNDVYKFNSEWYEGYNSNGTPFYKKKTGGSYIEFLYRTLDLHIENIEFLTLIKKNINNIYVINSGDAKSTINGYILEPNSTYKINFGMLERGSGGEEYFLNKGLISFVPCYEKELIDRLNRIIKGNII